MGLGPLEEGPYSAAVLRRTGTAATGTDRKVLALLDGEAGPDLLHPQVMAPPSGALPTDGPPRGEWPPPTVCPLSCSIPIRR
jgi:hypothetical protein